MTDRLTPGMLRDLALWVQRTGHFLVAAEIRSEAARREAEAKNKCDTPVYCEANSTCFRGTCEREGPGSAAAPHVEGLVAHAEVTADGELRLVTEEPAYEPPTFALRETWEIVALAMNQICDLLLNQNDPRYALLHEFANKLGERSEELKEYAKTLSPRAPVEDKPAPAADDLPERLRGLDFWSDPMTARKCVNEAADRIEAQAQKLEVQSMEIVEQTNARLSAEARVRELEARALTQVDADEWRKSEERADYQKARADRLAAALRLILPLARGYERPYHSGTAQTAQRRWIGEAEAALASEGGDR